MTAQRLYGPFIVFALLIVDQVSKWWMLENIFRSANGLGDPVRFSDWLVAAPERLPEVTLPITSFFNLSMVWNFGISFGLMQGMGLILLIGILAIIVGFSVWMLKSRDTAEICALGLILGGALGNVADRLRFGAVADFLDFHWNGYHFPAFNVADAAISIGVVLLLLYGLFFAPNRA